LNGLAHSAVLCWKLRENYTLNGVFGATGLFTSQQTGRITLILGKQAENSFSDSLKLSGIHFTSQWTEFAPVGKTACLAYTK
jgi:hypothetical protein